MKKISIILMALAMSACAAHQELNAPCKDFGKYCQTERVNGWG
jgi:hypothetical protein